MALLHWQFRPHQHIINFWINLFKTQNKLISYSTTRTDLIWPTTSSLQEANLRSIFLVHQLGSWLTTSSTSIYETGSSNESKLMAHITSITFMESSFSSKSPYLHKMIAKPKVCHLIFSSWSKPMSLFGETLGVMVWRAKKYV